MPDLSVLMPIYNERATVANAIEQVLEADLPVDDFELVIVDDHSTDGTREWLARRRGPTPCASCCTTATAARARPSAPR